MTSSYKLFQYPKSVLASEETERSRQTQQSRPGFGEAELSQFGEDCNSRLPTRLCPWPWSFSRSPDSGCSSAVPAPEHLHFLLRLRPFGPARLPSQMIPPRGGHRLHRRELEPPPGPVAQPSRRPAGGAERTGAGGTERGAMEKAARGAAHTDQSRRPSPAPWTERRPSRYASARAALGPPGGPGRLGQKARGGGPGPVCARRIQALLLQRSGVCSLPEETTSCFPSQLFCK